MLGMSGVAFGVAATVGTIGPGAAQLAQLGGLMGVGGVAGYQVSTVMLFFVCCCVAFLCLVFYNSTKKWLQLQLRCESFEPCAARRTA